MNTDKENQVSALNNTPAKAASVGQTLRETREQQGLSINDVANRIKFAPRQIESLEADDFAGLPEAAFVRGFVRSYARLLEIDPASLISALPLSHVQPAPAKEIKSVDVPMPTPMNARRHSILLLVAGLVIALSVAIYERMHARTPEKASVVNAVKVEELQLPAGTNEGSVAPVAEQPQAEAEPDASPQPVEHKESVKAAQKPDLPKTVAAPVVVGPMQPESHTSPPIETQKNAKTPAAQTVRPPRVATAPAVAASAATDAVATEDTNAAEHALRFELDEDAWLEVKDGNDKILISKMHNAGALVRVTGKAPMLVIIGNARAVRLFDNGKKIKLERYTTAEVARVKLK